MGRVVALVFAFFLAACGSETGPLVAGDPDATATRPIDETPGEPTETVTAGPRHTGTGIDQPPPFRLRYDGHELELHAHTYCYGGGCVDGIVQDPPSVGSPDEIRVFVPVPEFELDVSFTDARQECGGRSEPATVEDLGKGWYLLRPHGEPGRHRVSLFASGGGDMVGEFLWNTPSRGPYADPTAYLALIADHDGEPDSYGLELSVQHLAETPREVSATITVTAGNGRSLTIDAKQARMNCRSAGSVYFDGPDALAKEASELGDFPFRHDVVLTIDGTEYVATATFPDDVIKGEEPGMRLTFEPPLPGQG